MVVIHNKTAMLFEASSHTGALLAGADDKQEAALKDYGKHLGLAFQLVDDVLDYLGDAEAMGKNVGDDLAEGKTTLPLIYAMANGSDEERQLIRQAIRKRSEEHTSELQSRPHLVCRLLLEKKKIYSVASN